MTRKRVKLANITNDAARKTTYKKRVKGLVKKVIELTTLCGIEEACAVFYSPTCESSMPVMQQNNRVMNQESFPVQWLAKSNERLQKRVMFQHLGRKGLQNLEEDLNELGWLIQQNLKDIGNRIDMLIKTYALWGKYEY
ncbi:hypothetical protein V6N13_136396 [Hibiscus sabdariffa]